MTFGDWLNEQLQRRNWSMADFATMVGVARSTVSRWLNENRTPEPSTCQRIAVVLGVPVDVVFEHAGHQDYPARPQEELRAQITTMEHRAAELMTELETLHEQIEAAYNDLALLEEGELYSLLSPSEVALSVVRDFDLPDEIRPHLERRLATELVQLEPRLRARRATVSRTRQAAPDEGRARKQSDTDNA